MRPEQALLRPGIPRSARRMGRFVAQYRNELAQQRHWQIITSTPACSGEFTLLYTMAVKICSAIISKVPRDFLLAQCNA
ncbi:MAG: hypothetical protein ACR5LD_02650 [Symbiopectobacterium sp.]